MRVAELWRFPVKSLQGEQLDSAAVADGGIVGDRGYAIFDLDTGLGLTARRVPELLFASARLVADDRPPEITLPDGTIACGDAALSHWLGRRVALRAAADVDDRQYENPMDAEHDADWIVFDGAPGPFHDSARTRVSLVSTGTLGEWDRRRFLEWYDEASADYARDGAKVEFKDLAAAMEVSEDTARRRMRAAGLHQWPPTQDELDELDE